MKKVWRDVVHIDITTGERGGRIWVLRLSCGHTVFRRIPPLRLHTLTCFENMSHHIDVIAKYVPPTAYNCKCNDVTTDKPLKHTMSGVTAD